MDSQTLPTVEVEMPTNAPAEPLYTRHGTEPFDGAVLRDDKGRPCYYDRCSRCGGAGGYAGWPGWKCFRCGGDGREPNVDRLYTGAEKAKLDAASAKREAKRVAKGEAKVAAAQAQVEARREGFMATHGALLARCAAFVATDSFIKDVVTRATTDAFLTDKQVAALVTACDRLDARAVQAASSAWVGTVGDRLDVPVTVTAVATFERTSFRGGIETVHITTMTDAAGHQLVAKTPRFSATVGETFILRATVKAHDTFRDVKQTVVERPTMKEAK